MDVRVLLVKVSIKTKQCMPRCPVHCLADSDHFFPLLGIVSRTQPSYKNKLHSFRIYCSSRRHDGGIGDDWKDLRAPCWD